MKMHVVIVVVGFRNPGDISRCLAALEPSTHTDFEVVICENGGEAAYDALAAVSPAALPGGQPISVIRAPRNLGYAGGVNVGMKARPDADAWWILNPDTQPRPGALTALVERLSRGGCEAVGGPIYGPDHRVQMLGGLWRAWLARPVAIGGGRAVEERADAGEVESTQSFISGASMLVGRRFVETVGLMREDYFLYCEEAEWCLRGVARGMRLGFAPEALVLHEHGATTGAASEHHGRPRTPIYLDERNKMLLARDTFPARLAVAAPAALVLVFLRYARRGAWRQFGYGVSGWWAGLLGERGPPRWIVT